MNGCGCLARFRSSPYAPAARMWHRQPLYAAAIARSGGSSGGSSDACGISHNRRRGLVSASRTVLEAAHEDTMLPSGAEKDDLEHIVIYNGDRARPLRILKIMSVMNCTASVLSSPVVSRPQLGLTKVGHAQLEGTLSRPCLLCWSLASWP